MSEIKKKRGRPPLSPEERELRRIERNKRSSEAHKKSGYAADKRYRENNPDKISKKNRIYRNKNDSLTVTLSKEYRSVIDRLTNETGLSISDLFITAVEMQYDVKLKKRLLNMSSRR